MTTLHTEPNLRRRLNRRQKGFSLIELLIVIAIILVIAAIAVPNYNKYQMAGRETAVITELSVIYGAQTLYYSNFGKYAATDFRALCSTARFQFTAKLCRRL